MRRENYKQKTPGFGHQWNACMSLISSQRIIIENCAYEERFLRQPRSAWRFKQGAIIYHGRGRNRLSKRSMLKIFSMFIGPRKHTNSWCQVGRDPQPVPSYLIRIAEVVVIGKHTFSLQMRFSTNSTVCLFATPHRSLLTTVVQAESLRMSLKELEGLLENYSPMMDARTERVVDKVIKYGAIFAEVSSLTRGPAVLDGF